MRYYDSLDEIVAFVRGNRHDRMERWYRLICWLFGL